MTTESPGFSFLPGCNARVVPLRSLALIPDRAQHAQTIREGIEIAGPEVPHRLEARDFGDREAGFRDPQVDQGFDLEAVAPEHVCRVGAFHVGGRSRIKSRQLFRNAL